MKEKTNNPRLDTLLVEKYPNHSRNYFQWLIREGAVLVNGKSVKKHLRPDADDAITVDFKPLPEISLEPEALPLDIVYEDQYLLAINKPPGMVVHPAPGHHSGTFVNALLYHVKELPVEGSRPGIVHRLDKETSGLLLAAKTPEAHMLLSNLFTERKIDKRYLAITVGNPGNTTIDAPIKRHPKKRKEMAVHPDGRKSISIVKTLHLDGPLALVEVQLITGRTHQIRVHMKHHNTPILGDPTYGSKSSNQKFGASRQLLHAFKLSFLHPFTGKQLHLTAPPPEDFLSHYPHLPLH